MNKDKILNDLTHDQIKELRNATQPPIVVFDVVMAVMVLIGAEQTWTSA